jgi:hypothetical protein
VTCCSPGKSQKANVRESGREREGERRKSEGERGGREGEQVKDIGG